MGRESGSVKVAKNNRGVKDSGKKGQKGNIARLRVSKYRELYAPQRVNRSSLIFYLAVSILLYFGWHIRNLHLITPERGIGYALGIIGALMMILLVLYPIRKRNPKLEKMGSNRFWFWAHMGMGVLGPALVVIHSNFKLGSLNSRVVMASTLIVCTSGFVGLYLYTRIHYSLYGRRLNLEDLKEQYEENTNSLVILFSYAPRLQARLQEIESRILAPPTSISESVKRLLTMGVRIRMTQISMLMRLRKVLKKKAKQEGWSYEERERVGTIARHYIVTHMNAAVKIAEFTFFERLFSLWSILHFPLFILLVIAGIIHVVAVHLY